MKRLLYRSLVLRLVRRDVGALLHKVIVVLQAPETEFLLERGLVAFAAVLEYGIDVIDNQGYVFAAIPRHTFPDRFGVLPL